MICLGIESSCDDTCVALLDGTTVLAEVASSQVKLHALFGGVVPEVASREHAKHIGELCRQAFAQSGCSPEDVDLVAVTRGPGLLGSLLVGISFAKTFALGQNIPIIGVNHLHAHLLVSALEHPVAFPALGLLVSGGHTHLYWLENFNDITVLGKTLDDAAGEAFDKAGKMLGLPYPAGRHMDELSRKGTGNPKLFPRPYLDNDTFDFSFSGLKTAMQQYLNRNLLSRVGFDPLSGELLFSEDRLEQVNQVSLVAGMTGPVSGREPVRVPGQVTEQATGQQLISQSEECQTGQTEQQLYDVCASYTGAVVDTLAAKTERALIAHPDARSIILAGGVAANSFLRKAIADLAEKRGVAFYAPRAAYCADNAVMVAYLGANLYTMGYEHDLAFEAIPRGKAIPNDMIYVDSRQ